jgi:hypothetical protein
MRIDIRAFILAFAFGIFIVYVMVPEPQLVVKHPSPYNANAVTYKDKVGACFKIDATKTACPLNKSLIRAQPIAEDFR